MRVRVVCGLAVTIATFSPIRALSRVDLPALGRPRMDTNPDFKTETSPSSPRPFNKVSSGNPFVESGESCPVCGCQRCQVPVSDLLGAFHPGGKVRCVLTVIDEGEDSRRGILQSPQDRLRLRNGEAVCRNLSCQANESDFGYGASRQL